MPGGAEPPLRPQTRITTMKPARYLSMVIALGCATAAEPSSSARSAAYQGGVSQEQLRVASGRLREELAQLAETYAKYPGAAGDVDILRKTVAELEKLSNQDMAGVAKVLMDASRAMDATAVQGGISEASGGQKNIQIALRALADKLARQSDLTAMHKRLEALAIRQHVNLEGTKQLATLSPTFQKLPARMRDDHRARKDEQAALGKEATLAVEALDKLAADTQSETAAVFKQAADTARSRQLQAHADDANLGIDLDYAGTNGNQEQVLETLKAMIANLDAAKPAEQLTREMAAEMEELARKQEQLAQQTPRMNGNEQEQAAKEQKEIAAKLDIMEERIAKEDPQAATRTEQASNEASHAATELSDDRMRREADRIARTADQQNRVADEIEKIAEELDKKAEAMAANNQDQNQNQAEGQDPQQQQADAEESAASEAISEAMDKMQEAKTDLEIAQLQASRQQDSGEKAKSAMEKMDQAAQEMQNAGQGDSQAGKDLESAEKHAEQASQGQNPGQNLSQSGRKLAQAMSSLRNSMNQMAAKGTPSNQRGKGLAEGGMGGNADSGNLTRTDARGKASEGQRDALTLQQQDKVAPAYETAVNQYLKNLAEDTEDEP